MEVEEEREDRRLLAAVFEDLLPRQKLPRQPVVAVPLVEQAALAVLIQPQHRRIMVLPRLPPPTVPTLQERLRHSRHRRQLRRIMVPHNSNLLHHKPILRLLRHRIGIRLPRAINRPISGSNLNKKLKHRRRHSCNNLCWETILHPQATAIYTPDLHPNGIPHNNNIPRPTVYKVPWILPVAVVLVDSLTINHLPTCRRNHNNRQSFNLPWLHRRGIQPDPPAMMIMISPMNLLYWKNWASTLIILYSKPKLWSFPFVDLLEIRP